jgi:hypothetical protein
MWELVPMKTHSLRLIPTFVAERTAPLGQVLSQKLEKEIAGTIAVQALAPISLPVQRTTVRYEKVAAAALFGMYHAAPE